jgi:tricorn protease-like protein
VTDGLYDKDAGSYMAYAASYYVRSSEDGRYLFFPQEIASDYTFDLYRLDLTANNQKNSSAVKVASGISDYQLSSDGKLVFYMEDGKLNYSDIDEKTKIESDVVDFYIRGDGTRLIYQDSDGKLYFSDSKKGGKSRSSTATSTFSISRTT